MRVHLQAKAQFYFPVTLGLVKQLIQYSKHHYDGECQRASARVGRPLWPGSTSVHSQNGVLAIWHDRFDDDAKDDAQMEVHATWDQLDLLSKICEFNGDSMALAFRRAISGMLAFAGPKVMTEWKEEFDV